RAVWEIYQSQAGDLQRAKRDIFASPDILFIPAAMSARGVKGGLQAAEELATSPMLKTVLRGGIRLADFAEWGFGAADTATGLGVDKGLETLGGWARRKGPLAPSQSSIDREVAEEARS